MRHRAYRWSTTMLLSTLGHLLSPSAHAWDPTSTHPQLTERALLQSQLHVRWMEQTAMQRGLFTPLRVDPERLPDDIRRQLQIAVDRAPAGAGAVPLGGPRSCPPSSAPPRTRELCIEGNRWETDAIGWIRLGIIAEVTPPARLLHHFANPQKPGSPTWTAPDMSPLEARRTARALDLPLAARVNGTAFDGTARSAIAWLHDEDDPWAPPALARYLRSAALAPTAAEREHHLALGLVSLGAILHVLQDLTVPAHARGDILAFWQPLSDQWRDRGLPLQEYVRDRYGAGELARSVDLSPREAAPKTDGEPDDEAYVEPVASSLGQLVLGQDAWTGLVPFTAQRFLSASAFPSPIRIAADASAQEAAARLLADVSVLHEEEREGARLEPWPAPSGYLLNAAGRPLAAFRHTPDGRVALFFDQRIYRDAAAHLLPRAVLASASAIDLLFPAFPAWAWDTTSGVLRVDLPELEAPKLSIVVENAAQQREVVRTVALEPGTRNRIEGVTAAKGDAQRTILVLEATRGGMPLVLEQSLVRPAEIEVATPPVAPTEPDPAAPTEPDPAEPETPEPDPAEPDPDPAEPTEPETPEPDPAEPTEPETPEPETLEPE